MRLVPSWAKAKLQERRIRRMSRRAFLGIGLAASATVSHAGMIWLKSRTPATSAYFTTVNSATALRNLLTTMRGSPATYAGKIIGVLDGDYSGGGDGAGSRFDATGIACASTVLFYGDGDNTATWPGVDFSNSTNLIFQRIAQFRTYDSGAAICGAAGSTNCGLDSCDVGSTPLNTFDYRFRISTSGGAGSFANGETLHVVTSRQVPYTSGHTAFGTYASSGSSASVTCFAYGTPSSPSPSVNYATEIAKWNGGKILQNADGTAWRNIASTANVSAPVSGTGILIMIGVSGDCTGLFLQNNTFHDLRWSWAGALVDLNAQYNTLTDIYQSFFDMQNVFSGATIKWNTGEHLWGTHSDGVPGTSGVHTSISGFSVSSSGRCSNVTYQMNVLTPGFNRFLLPATQGGGVYANPGGPEMNDQGAQPVSTSGIGGCIGGTGGISSTSLVITSGPASTSNPKIVAGMSVRYQGGPYDDSVTIVSQQSGSTGQAGTYTISSPLTIPDGTHVTITTVNDGWDIRGNLIIAGDNIGWEFAYAKNCKFLWNTIVCNLDTPVAASIYRHDLYTGNLISKNVTNAFATANPPGVISPDVYTGSTDNVCALYGEPVASAGSYYGLYAGKTGSNTASDFQNLDVAGALAAFTPKGGGRIASGYGHSAYVNFTNRTTNFPADPTPITSNVANGISTNKVHFDSTTYSRWFSPSNGAPLLGFSTGNLLTVIFQMRLAADGSDDARSCYLHVAKNQAYFVQRNTNGTITFSIDSASGTVALSATTSFTVNGADGYVVVMFTVDIPNYKIYASKGNFVDPLLTVSPWSGAHMLIVNGNNNASIGNNYTGTSGEFRGDMGVINIHEGYIDANTVAGISKVVAQDGLPISYGTDGSTLWGVASKVAINNVAADWNVASPGGVNNGTAGVFIKQAGTYTDAV